MVAKEMRIVYMGTPDFAVEPLRRMVEGGYNVVAVVTMPDKPMGRGQKLKCSAVKDYALSVSLPILQPEKLSAPEFVDELNSYKPDLGIVVAFKMLPSVVWSLPRLGTFNLHASLLPDYRGAAPINWAIMNGDTVSGITTFLLNKEIDTGDVLCREEVEIRPEDNAGTLHDKLMLLGGELVLKSINSLASGEVIPVAQNTMTESDTRPAPKIFKDTCKLDWTHEVNVLHNKVRGLSPYPAAWCELGVNTFKVFASECEPNAAAKVGEILTDGAKSLKVGCAGGYLHITELQMAGKKRMKIGDFLRGHNFNY